MGNKPRLEGGNSILAARLGSLPIEAPHMPTATKAAVTNTFSIPGNDPQNEVLFTLASEATLLARTRNRNMGYEYNVNPLTKRQKSKPEKETKLN